MLFCALLWQCLHFFEATFEKTALAVVSYQLERGFVTLGGFVVGSEPAQQVGPGGVQQVIIVLLS